MGFNKMLLLVDIGNTNITVGISNGETILKKWAIPVIQFGIAAIFSDVTKRFIENVEIDGCVIASVVEGLDLEIKKACDDLFGVNSLIVTKEIIDKLPIAIKYPQGAGIDRIINVIAARKKYSGITAVVDLGSAITIDVISENGDFAGGMIMPGVKLQLKALNEYTSKLPLLEPQKSNRLIGENTEEAILSGVVRGIGAAIDGLLQQIEDEAEKDQIVIATGGDAELISEYSFYAFNFVDVDLTLNGMKYIYEVYLNS